MSLLRPPCLDSVTFHPFAFISSNTASFGVSNILGHFCVRASALAFPFSWNTIYQWSTWVSPWPSLGFVLNVIFLKEPFPGHAIKLHFLVSFLHFFSPLDLTTSQHTIYVTYYSYFSLSSQKIKHHDSRDFCVFCRKQCLNDTWCIIDRQRKMLMTSKWIYPTTWALN